MPLHGFFASGDSAYPDDDDISTRSVAILSVELKIDGKIRIFDCQKQTLKFCVKVNLKCKQKVDLMRGSLRHHFCAYL